MNDNRKFNAELARILARRALMAAGGVVDLMAMARQAKYREQAVHPVIE